MLWFMKISALLTTGILTLPAQNVCGKICDGGHSCTVPMDCCSKGCCYSSPGGIPSISSGGVSPPRLLGGSGAQHLLFLPAHWYFWALVAAGALCAACACALWRRRRAWACCRRRRDASDHRSDPGSSATGSCYAPPHYSRCSSFHQAPPPYSEVASKPDMYPLVISYSMGCDGANTKTPPASYLMVQYFRNYILQPAGSISATSTIDSLSSSFICNAANEANSIIPPPYSCTGSLDEFTVPLNRTSSPQNVVNSSQMLRSVSNITCSEYQTCEASSNPQTNTRSTDSSPVAASTHEPQQRIRSESPNIPTNNFVHSTPIKTHTKHVPGTVAGCTPQRNPLYLQNKTTSFVNNVNMPQANGLDNRLAQYQDVPNNLNRSSAHTSELNCSLSEVAKASHGSVNSYDTPRRSCDLSVHKTRRRNIGIFRDSSEESEMCQVPGPNHHGQMNLSLATASITNCDSNSQIGTPTNNLTDFSGHIEFDAQPNLDELQRTYSVANSNTGSDISSLANLGTPDSPPRATSPTVEIRELLDKIQQLPQQKSPCEPQSSSGGSGGVAATIVHSVKPKRYFLKSKAKTLYMPLNKGKNVQKPAGIFGVSAKGAKGWLSRSAPTTPCAGFVPVFPTQRKSSAHASRRGSKSGDGSPLLVEQDGSDDERNGDCV